ncbi:10089_t:CDS:2 [Gigaspora margarita]|uniref:10089_t:CDS:1 n=1 Tax=Gigaspora margarita TaxID=4874 RepID=A0ABM8W4W8_GIGMA|nr:10089_t:CDS:2 [Gigaspora margarita]
MEKLISDDQLFNLMLGEFPANFIDRNGFGIEPPHNPINNYTTQEFNAIRSNVIKTNNDSQLSTLLRFHVEQHKIKRLEFCNSIKNEYGDAEKEIKARHDELELLRLCGFDKNIDGLINDDDELIMNEGKMVKEGMNNQQETGNVAEILEHDKKIYDEYCSKYEMFYNQLQLDHELIKVSQQRQYERLKKLHSFVLGKVEATQSTSPVTSISDNSLCMKSINEKGNQQNSIAEQPLKTLVDQNNDTLIKDDDSAQPDTLSKQFKAFKFQQKKFTANKDILSMECVSEKQTTQSSTFPDKDKTSNFDDKHLPTSPSSSTSWGGRSKYSYSYIPRSKPIMEKPADYSIHNFRRSIKPRPYRKLRPYDNRYHRVFQPFRSEIKSFNPTYSHKVWKNDYTSSKFSERYPRDKDSTSIGDSSTQHMDRFSSSSSFINNHETTQHTDRFSSASSSFINNPESTQHTDRFSSASSSFINNPESTQHTDRFSSASSSFINNPESTLPESPKHSSNNHNHIPIPKTRSSTEVDPMELGNSQQITTTVATSSISSTLTNPSTTSNNNTDKKQFSLDIISYIPSDAMSLLDDKMSINDDNGDNRLNTIQKNSMDSKFSKYMSYDDQYKHDYKPIDDYRVHKPGSFIQARRYNDKHLRNDSYDNFNNGEKRVSIQQDYPPPRHDRHDSHHMASDLKGNFEINRYHSQLHRVYNPKDIKILE